MQTAATIAALALTVAVSACASPQQQEFTRAEADVVRKTAADLSAAFNAKNVDEIAGLFSAEAVFMPPNAPLVRGKEAIRSYFSGLIAKGATKLQLDPNVGGHGPLAYQTGAYRLNYEPGNGSPTRDRGKYVFVLRNMNGKWLFEHAIWSSDLPAAP